MRGFCARSNFDPHTVERFDPIAAAWLPFVFAMNSVNRAIGMRDMYPFILSPAVIVKLRFIHDLLRGVRSGRHACKWMERPGRGLNSSRLSPWRAAVLYLRPIR